jgi:hypothetical protein
LGKLKGNGIKMQNLYSLLLSVSRVVVLPVGLPLVLLVEDEIVGRGRGFATS